MIEFTALNLTAPDSSIIGVIEIGTPALEGPGVLRHTLSQMDAVAKSREVGR
jgi:hypothetical protein